MKKEDLFRAIGEVPDGQVLEARRSAGTVRRPARRRWLSLAACLTLLIGAAAAWPRLAGGPGNMTPPPAEDGVHAGDSDNNSDNNRGDSNNGSENPENNAPPYSRGVAFTPLDLKSARADTGRKGASEDASSSLAWRSPQEILARDTLIFRGVVENMAYFTVDKIGSLTGYFTVAEVRVTEALRGDLAEGDLCRVYLPVVRGVMSTSIAGNLEALDVGSEAIFMPKPAGPDTGVHEEDRYFCYADVADAYFSEGIRFLFLQTEEGLQFERAVYDALQDAQTLDDVAEYLRDMLDALA